VTALAGTEAMILALRVGFAASLYLFVAVAIIASVPASAVTWTCPH
jgi:hypothetical protein